MATVFEVRDEVWEVVEPLLPDLPAQTTGRPRVPDRVAFNAIVFVLVTGIAWRLADEDTQIVPPGEAAAGGGPPTGRAGRRR
jgi:transposase